MNQLRKELYDLVKTDHGIFDFIQDIALDGLSYCEIENPDNEWMSPKFLLTLGYSPEEMAPNRFAWKHLIYPDDLQLALDNFNKHIENPDHPRDYVIRFNHKNGSTVWIRCRCYAIRNNDGKAFRILRAHQDITKQKEHEEKYDLLFNSIDEGFCIIEMIFDEQKKPVDYRFLAINTSFEKQTGLHGAVGKRMREFAPNHEERWFEIYGKIALTGEPIRFENRAEQLQRWYDVLCFSFRRTEELSGWNTL
jgi:PAS domain S-box-containing protein